MAKKSESHKIVVVKGPKFFKTKNNFPRLERLAQDFYQKNNLPKPEINKIGGKVIMNFGEKGLVLLTLNYSQDGTLGRPAQYVGSSSSYISTTGKYKLEGKLDNKKIKLEAEITETMDTPYELDTKPRIEKSRIDKVNYWFVTKAKK